VTAELFTQIVIVERVKRMLGDKAIAGKRSEWIRHAHLHALPPGSMVAGRCPNGTHA